MNFEEGKEFLTELIKINASNTNPTGIFPFQEESISAIVEFVIELENCFLIPREIIKKADGVLSEAEVLIESGDLSEIDRQFVLTTFEGYNGET